MVRHPYHRADKPETTEEGGGSIRITIPATIRDALDLEAGEKPERVEFDMDTREFAMQFETEA